MTDIENLQVIGHRGVPSLCPENTLSSFIKAIELGVDAIEFDVHSTCDGELVITHDESVERCSNGKGFVRDFAFADIRKLDFGSWKSPEFSGTKIPELSEALDLILDGKPEIHLLIELKANDGKCAEKVLEIIRKRSLLENSTVLSFHPEMLQRVRRLEPEIHLQGFPDRYVECPSPDTYELINKTCIWLNELTMEEIGFFHSRNIEVDTCPVDDAEALEKALRMAPDSITTNAADMIMPMLKRKKKKLCH